MTALLRLLKAEPVATMAVVSALTGLAVLAGVPEDLCGAVAVLIGAVLAFPVRSNVRPEAQVAALVTEAAEQASTQVAKTLSVETVGAVGDLTEQAAGVVQSTVSVVTGDVLGPSSHRKK